VVRLSAYFRGLLTSEGVKAPAIDLLMRVKKPAVATAAFCDPRPTATPVLAAVSQGV